MTYQTMSLKGSVQGEMFGKSVEVCLLCGTVHKCNITASLCVQRALFGMLYLLLSWQSMLGC